MNRSCQLVEVYFGSKEESWERKKAGAVRTEIKSSLTVLKVPWHYNNDVILQTDEKQPLNQGPSVSIQPEEGR